MPRNFSSPAELTVGQVASGSGVSASALPFYAAEGPIHSTRTPGNQRRFPREVLRRVTFIRASQAVGIPLRRIRGSRPPARQSHANAWGLGATLRNVARRPRSVDRRGLQRLRDRLSGCIDWMPFSRPVQTGRSGRSARSTRTRSAKPLSG